MKRMIVLLILLFACVSPVMAGTEVTINLESLSSKARDAVLQAQAAEAAEMLATTSGMDMLNPANADALEKYGQVVAKTIKEVCNTLNVEVNEFIKTPVGMIVGGLIFYKVAGEDLMEWGYDFFSKWFGLMIGIPIWAWTFRRMHLGRKIKTVHFDENGKKNRVEVSIDRFDWRSADMQSFSYVIHIGGFIVMMAIAIFV